MKLTSVLVTVLVAVVLQVTLARYTVGGRWVFDLVLVGVVYAALLWGPVAGMLAGTIGGLLQDVLAGDVVGVGGLAKTLVGFAAGVVGTQFVLVRPHGADDHRGGRDDRAPAAHRRAPGHRDSSSRTGTGLACRGPLFWRRRR